MKSTKTYLLVLFVLLALGAGGLAWKEYQELTGLRAAALTADERADLQKRTWAAEKRARDLAAELAAARAPAAPGDKPGAARPGGKGGSKPTDDSLTRLSQMMDFLNSSDAQGAIAAQQKNQVQNRYGPLLKALNLPPALLAQFKDLLVEKQAAITDVIAADIQQGIDPSQNRQEFLQLIANAQAETDGRIQSALSPEAYAQYQAYQQTMFFRDAVGSLQQGMSGTASPLTDDQTAQVSNGVAAIALGSLSPAQMQVLQQRDQVMAAGQTLQQLQQLYQNQSGGAKAGGTAAPTAARPGG